MAFWNRKEKRDSIENPSTPLARIFEILDGGSKTSAGVDVTDKNAMNLAAVWACVRLLAEDVGTLPLEVYERTGKGKQKATDHRLYSILHDKPNPDMSAVTFRETLQGHLASVGNAFAEKQFDGAGRITSLWPIAPTQIKVELKNSRKTFEVLKGNDWTPIPSYKIFHIPGFGYDGLLGYSPLTMHRQAIGLTKAAEEFGAQFFGNGARASVILEHPNKLSPQAKENLKTSWLKKLGGKNQLGVAVAEEGMKVNQISINPDDAQFLETRKFQKGEIATIWRIPPHMIGDLEHATFSNIEQQSIEYVTRSLRPYLVRWEQAINSQLFSDADQGKYFAEHNVEGMLRGDVAARGQFYQTLFNLGVASPNDIREKENMNPVDGGDQRFVQLNLVPLEKAADVADATIKKAAEPAPAPVATDTPKRSLPWLGLVEDVMERVSRKELNAASRALKKGIEAFGEWSEGFYREYGDELAQRLLPVFRAMAHGEDIGDFLVEYSAIVGRNEAERITSVIRSRLNGESSGVDAITRYYDENADGSRDKVRAKSITEQAAATITARLTLQREAA